MAKFKDIPWKVQIWAMNNRWWWMPLVMLAVLVMFILFCQTERR